LQNVPEFRKITVAVVAEGWLSLVGPPSSLARLESWSADIRNASHLETDISGPIHSPWVPKIDLAKVLGKSPLLCHPIDLAKATMISPGSCMRYQHLTLGSLLEEVVEDIAHNVLYVTKLIQGCISNLDRKSMVKLTMMGPTKHLASIKHALKTCHVEYQLNQPSMAMGNEMARGGSDLIAIVGMSGRFPGSETVEGFWEDLIAGKCHIKEVSRGTQDRELHLILPGRLGAKEPI
jgi:Beta-ketoacyl synthase, N-terminal domain